METGKTHAPTAGQTHEAVADRGPKTKHLRQHLPLQVLRVGLQDLPVVAGERLQGHPRGCGDVARWLGAHREVSIGVQCRGEADYSSQSQGNLDRSAAQAKMDAGGGVRC